MAYIICEGCNCRLREEDGPLCLACKAKARSEAARAAAETRRQQANDEEPTNS